MLALTSSRLLRPPGPGLTPGGFVWWYLDLTDDSGDGMVLIWSLGLPFLPGIGRAARSGAPAVPAEHPALNVVLYRGGRPDLYLLQSADPAGVRWEVGRWAMGGLRGCLSEDAGQTTLRLDLDCEVPHSTDHLVGQVTLTGSLRRGGGDAEGASHGWTPLLTAAAGRAQLRCGASQWDLRGRAYFDRNTGTVPLHDLGIDRWWWLRLALPDRELIGYHLLPRDPAAAPQSLSITVDPDGHTQTAAAPLALSGWRRRLIGLSWPRTITLTPPGSAPVTVRLAHLIDDGPFYQRFQIEADIDGHTARGFAEQVVPDRIDAAWSRPLVRMAVHRHDGDNSVWLPLFSGPRAGRLQRLLGLTPPPRQLPADLR